MFLEPIKTDSLVEAFVKRFEELIISGKIKIGQKLPSERELAVKLGVSRPVVHEGLILLQQKGLISLKPRVGAVVNDYRHHGSLALLQSLITYRKGNLEPQILESLLAMRMLFEIETTRLASINRTKEHIACFTLIIDQEKKLTNNMIEEIVEADFAFHHCIALASGNFVYPLLMNSFKQVYTNLTRQFFTSPKVTHFVFAAHERLVEAIINKDTELAVHIMQEILNHGQYHLRRFIKMQKQKEAL